MSEEVIPVVIIVPILNFDCSEDAIRLSRTLLLRRVKTDEIENIVRQLPNTQLLRSTLGDIKFVIELTSSSEEISNTYFGPDDADSEIIETSFKLLGIEEPSMPTSFCVSAVSLYVSNPFPKRNTAIGNYQILKSEQIGEFKILWKAVKKAIAKETHLSFPLSQFNRSFEDSINEKFIDYITAFESIVFGRGTNAPSPYGRTIGIAVGMLIGRNEKERASIEKKLNESYEVRNKVVHGHLRHKLEDTDDEKFEELLNFTKECLIESLKKLLKE